MRNTIFTVRNVKFQLDDHVLILLFYDNVALKVLLKRVNLKKKPL